MHSDRAHVAFSRASSIWSYLIPSALLSTHNHIKENTIIQTFLLPRSWHLPRWLKITFIKYSGDIKFWAPEYLPKNPWNPRWHLSKTTQSARLWNMSGGTSGAEIRSEHFISGIYSV